MSPEEERRFFAIVEEVCAESQFPESKKFIQHGETTVYAHSLAVAYFSYWVAQRYHVKVREKELIRGALLHDYFLYDWHEKRAGHRFHGFTHPGAALKNASQEFALSPVEKDIIRKHMFPLTPIPPRYRETVLVCMADKICSTYETLHLQMETMQKIAPSL